MGERCRWPAHSWRARGASDPHARYSRSGRGRGSWSQPGPPGGTSHTGVLGVRHCDVTVRARLVWPRSLQRSGTRRTWVRPADVRPVPGRYDWHWSRRATWVRLAVDAVADAATAGYRDVPVRRGARAHAAAHHARSAVVAGDADRSVGRHGDRDLLRCLAPRV